jgi:hypothetical protein
MMKFAFRVIFTRPPFSKWLLTKSSNCQWSDFNENWYLGVFWSDELVGAMNSDMGVVWELLCLHSNTIKPSYYYITPTAVGWCIAILRFSFTIITSLRTQSSDVLLFYVSFSLLLLLFLLLLLLFFHTFLSALFLGDALIKLYETL